MWKCGKCNECDTNWLRRMRCLKCDKPCPQWVRTAALDGVKEDSARRGGHGVTGGGGGKGGRGGHGVTDKGSGKAGKSGGRGGRGGYGVTGQRAARVSDRTFGTYLHAAQHGQNAASKIAQLQKELKAAKAKAQVPSLSTAAGVGDIARQAEAAGFGPEVVAPLKAAAAKAESAAKEAANSKTPQERYLEADKALQQAEAAREKQERTLVRIQSAINKQQELFEKGQVELGRLKAQSAAAQEEHECAVRALPGATGHPGPAASSLDAPQAISLALGHNVRAEVVAMPELQLLLNEFRQAYAGKCAGIELIEKADAERRVAAAAASQDGLPQSEPGVDITLLDATDSTSGSEQLAAPPGPTLPSTPAPGPFKLPVDQAQLETMFAGKIGGPTALIQIAEQVNSMVEAHALQPPPPPPNTLGEDRYTPHGGEPR